MNRTSRNHTPSRRSQPFLSALIVAAVAGLAAPANAELQYDFFLVESFDTDYDLAETYVFDINNDDVGLGSDTFGGFLWTEAEEKIELPWNGANSINNLGWVNYGATLYHPDTQQQIDIPEPSMQYPIQVLVDVNDVMVGVGVSSHTGPGCEPFDCPYDCGKALVWDEINGSYHLPVPDLKALHAVNNHNVAVGVVITNCDDNRGIVYNLDTGDMTNLSDLLPPNDLIGRPAQVWPTDINDAGQVIGLAIAGDQAEKPFIWSEDAGFTYLPTIPGGEYGYMYVNKINNNGVVVGEAMDWSETEWKSFIWDADNGIRVLETLVDEPANFEMENAYSLNDNGWIVGSGHFGPGWATQRGFVLKPVVGAIPGDLDGDGDVDQADLGILLGDWGCTSGDCVGDVDGDGNTDQADLGALLANYGT